MSNQEKFTTENLIVERQKKEDSDSDINISIMMDCVENNDEYLEKNDKLTFLQKWMYHFIEIIKKSVRSIH